MTKKCRVSRKSSCRWTSFESQFQDGREPAGSISLPGGVSRLGTVPSASKERQRPCSCGAYQESTGGPWGVCVDELLQTECVKDLAAGPDAGYVKLLELFAYGSFSDYKSKCVVWTMGFIFMCDDPPHFFRGSKFITCPHSSSACKVKALKYNITSFKMSGKCICRDIFLVTFPPSLSPSSFLPPSSFPLLPFSLFVPPSLLLPPFSSLLSPFLSLLPPPLSFLPPSPPSLPPLPPSFLPSFLQTIPYSTLLTELDIQDLRILEVSIERERERERGGGGGWGRRERGERERGRERGERERDSNHRDVNCVGFDHRSNIQWCDGGKT